MDQYKTTSIKAQYILAIVSILIYIICYLTSDKAFTLSFLILAPLSIIQIMTSAFLLILCKKDISLWKSDVQLVIGIIVLISVHALSYHFFNSKLNIF